MNTVELFSGTGSFSKIARLRDCSIFRVEKFNHFDFEAELFKDILDVKRSDLPKKIDVLWASPPCTAFSVASIGKNWVKGVLVPKTSKGALGLAYVLKTLELIEQIKKDNPNLMWFIENPRGMLRKFPFMEELHRNTVTYCQYGDTRMKPTDIWTNNESWIPRPMCKNGDSCHASAPRGSRTGTQGLKGNMERSIIPPILFEEIFEVINKNWSEQFR